jgi:hypothetical protein
MPLKSEKNQLRRAAPEIAVKVEQGELTLKDAAGKVVVVREKQVMPEVDQWWWDAGTEDDQGIEEHRKNAEKSVLECFPRSSKAMPK